MSDHGYKGLSRLLYGVRWSQHFLSIVAEVLILLAFAMSGMDVSLGGVMASIPMLKTLWAAMFALGIDTAFALSWVRVRSSALKRQWVAFGSSLILALAMSFIIFEPIAVQLFEQTLNVSFEKALNDLGINIVLLTYARSGVAVFLGAILAITNVESATNTTEQTPSTKPFWRLLAEIAQKVGKRTNSQQPAQLPASDEQENSTTEPPAQEVDAAKVSNIEPVSEGKVIDLKARRQKKYEIPVIELDNLSTYERVCQVLKTVPQISDRELGKLCDCAAATAKKHRERYKRERAVKPIESEE